MPVEDDLTEPVRPIVAANGGEMELLGKNELRLRVGEVDVHFPVLTARELTSVWSTWEMGPWYSRRKADDV